MVVGEERGKVATLGEVSPASSSSSSSCPSDEEEEEYLFKPTKRVRSSSVTTALEVKRPKNRTSNESCVNIMDSTSIGERFELEGYDEIENNKGSSFERQDSEGNSVLTSEATVLSSLELEELNANQPLVTSNVTAMGSRHRQYQELIVSSRIEDSIKSAQAMKSLQVNKSHFNPIHPSVKRTRSNSWDSSPTRTSVTSDNLAATNFHAQRQRSDSEEHNLKSSIMTTFNASSQRQQQQDLADVRKSHIRSNSWDHDQTENNRHLSSSIHSCYGVKSLEQESITNWKERLWPTSG